MKKNTKKLIFNIVVCLLLVAGLVWVCARFIHLGRVEWTDNAQVKQQIVPVNARVRGFVEKIYFEEYQQVKKGDTLLVIEDTEYRLRLAQAEADYKNATTGKSAMQSSINTTANNIAVSDAAIEEAKVRLDNAKREYERYNTLLAQEAVTKQQYDNVKTAYDAAKARYEMLVRQRESTSLVKQEQTTRLGQNDAGIAVAESALELAKLNLSYTVILAPCDGTLGRKNIQEGQLIQPGQTVVDIVDASDIWVVANYKETQTANIEVGMPVEISVDAVPDVTYRGVVESLSNATGASYSLVPQDNSSGNFIKVEQRVPVRIKFTDDNSKENMARLRSGLNVETEVKY